MAPVATFGNSSVIRSETAFGITAAPLGETGALVCYKDSVTGRGMARVARVSGTLPGDQVAVGEEVEFSAEDDGVGADSIAVAALGSSKVLICWRQATTNFGLMRVASIGASVDGLSTTISFGVESQFFPPDGASAPKLCCLAVAALGSGKAVLAYQDAFARSGEAVLITVSGLSATAADERVILESGDVSSMAVAALDGSTAVVSYRDAAGSGVAATVAVVGSIGGEGLQLVGSTPFLSPADINWISAIVSRTQGDDLALSPHEDRAIDRAGLSQVLSRVVTTAQLISPAPGSTLIGTDVTFSWSAGVDASEYRLHIGTVPGGTDILFRSAGTDLSVIVTGLPDNGETLFVSLWSRRGSFTGDGDWAINEFVLTAFDATPPTTVPPFTTTAAPPPTTTPVPTTAPPPTTAAPTIDSPIGEGATSVSGTGVDGATVEIFVDLAPVGNADAPVAAGVWIITGLLSPLVVGNEVVARQVSLGELQSDISDIVVVQALSDAPAVNSPIFRLATVVSGTSTELEGTPISVSVDGTPVGSATVAAGGVWAAVVPPVETGDEVTATATATDELESPPSAAVTVQAPVSAPPTVSFPVGEGAISVGGTGAPGGIIRVLVDRGSGFVDSGPADAPVDGGGFWSKTGLSPALAAGDLVKATQTQLGSSESGDSNTVTVQAFTAIPVVSFPIFDGDPSILGTSTEVNGTAIEVFVNGGSAGITVVSTGNWSLVVPPLTAGDQIKAIATALGKLESPESATVTVLPSETDSPIVSSPIPEGATTITGLGVNTATVTVFVNGGSVGTTTVIGTDWVKMVVFPLSAGDIVKATQEIPPSSPSVDSNEVTVQEISAAPTVDSPIFDADTSVSGTGVNGATVEVFVNGGTIGNADAPVAAGTWTKTSLSLSDGEQIKAIATEFGKLESPDSNIVTVIVPTPPLLASPIADGDTSVEGTGEPGAIIRVFINAILDGSADAVVSGGGLWERTGMAALLPGQVVTARQTEGTDPESGDSNPVIVQAFSDAPTVDAPIVDTQTLIDGTTGEGNGTTIRVFVNGAPRGQVTITTAPIWKKVVSPAVDTGDLVTATAQGPDELESPLSVAVVVVGLGTSTIPPPLTTSPPTTPPPMVAGVVAAEINACTRDIAPDDYTPGAPNTVTLTCTIDAGITSTYIVEDIYPAGWTVSNISPGGVNNGTSVRWFFLDNASRVLSYDATPPFGETGTKIFSGFIDSDGSGGFQEVDIGGETDTVRSGIATTTAIPATTAPATTTVPGTTAPPGSNLCVRSFSVAEYVPEEAFTVSLDCDIDPAEVSTYIVEDTYPAGWTVTSTSTGGVDNGISVRWFFLNNSDRILTYAVEPPTLASGDATFSGKVDSDGPGGFINTPTVGDQIIGEFVAIGITTAPPPTTAPPTTTAPGGTTTAPATTVPPPPPGSFPDIEAGDVEHLTVSGLDGGRMLLTYRSNARHRHGRAIVATATHDGTITFGNPSSFLGSRVEEVFAVPLSGDTGMVFYRVGTDIFAKLFRVEVL